MAEQLQIRWILIRGDSMWPALRTGDRARCEPLTEAPRPGEVIVARVGGALVAHRVVEVGARIALRGDNCARRDPDVDASAIFGRITAVERDGAVLAAAQWDRGPSLLGRLRLRAMRLARRLS